MKTALVRTFAALAVATLSIVPVPAMADAVFFQGHRFQGASFSTPYRVASFDGVFRNATRRDAGDRGRHRLGDDGYDRDDDDRDDQGRYDRDGYAHDRDGNARDGNARDGNARDGRHDQRGDRRHGASSVVVFGERWEVCDATGFRGRCRVLRPGRYASVEAMGLRYRVSSARVLPARTRIDDVRLAPRTLSVYDDRRRNNERLYEAEVTSARAVYGVEERRCWIEREQVEGPRPRGNGAGAVVGAILGGILGHQVGNGSTRDVATVGGAIAGGAVGYNVGRSRNGEYERDVQRCVGAARSTNPDYWAVTYEFRGTAHAMQAAYEPGDTVTVNRHGEPRANAR